VRSICSTDVPGEPCELAAGAGDDPVTRHNNHPKVPIGARASPNLARREKQANAVPSFGDGAGLRRTDGNHPRSPSPSTTPAAFTRFHFRPR
jgi:hypothetical protein